MDAQNGAGNGKVYVRFGSLETQEMPLEWAEKMLTAWRDANPNQFGKTLQKVVLELR